MEKTLFLSPYLLSLAISLGVLVYSWRRRHVRGAQAYIWYVAGQSLWTFGYILELLSPEIEGKIFWDSFQWIAGLFITIAFPIFAVQYSEKKIHGSKLLVLLSLIAPVIFLLVLFTDHYHHLLYPNPYLDNSLIFSDLKYDFTWIVYAYAIYSYLVTISGLVILTDRLIRPLNLYRRQIFTVVIGFLIPILFTMLTAAGVDFMPFRDVSPFTFAAGNLIIVWGLFRYKLFSVVPIARDLIIDNMDDVIVVLDTQDRVVDINRTALETIKKTSAQVIGQSAHVAFDSWPELIQQFEQPSKSMTKPAIVTFGKQFHYEFKSNILYRKRKHYVGRVFVARDITERVELENNLKALNAELEERVASRTEELRKTAERYRAVVENQTELIVHCKLDGTRTFVNEAYLRHFGLTKEQAIGKNFLDHVETKDQINVQKKYARLESGEIDVETDIHRVINPDGSVGWQEWTDRAVRDEDGNVIEIQSIGRDITEKKQAELALQRSENLYRRAINAAGAVPYVLSHDANGYEFIFIGENIIQLTGYSVSEITREIWESMIQEGFPRGKLSHLTLEEADQITNKDHSLLWECDFCIQTRDGKTRWISDTSVKGLDEKGEKTISIGIYQDITERKQAERKLAEAYDTTLEGWAKALELRDKETEDHSRRVTELTVILAQALGIQGDELMHIRRGAILHDIGKMGTPDEILRKRGELTVSERRVIEQHPTYSFELLSQIPYLEKALDIPYCHHEKWDGSGYPRGLKGNEIPIAARIFAIIDVWDAVQSDRPYKKAWSRDKAIALIKEETGTHFDPDITKIFLELVEQGKI